MEKQIRKLGLANQVHLPGFKQYDELPNYYGFASSYIQASTTEQWGLAVNEAMASGLPVIVLNRCGCAPDLVKEGVNDYSFNPFNETELANLMTKVATDESKLAIMGRQSQKIIANWTPEIFSQDLLTVAKIVVALPLPKVRWIGRAILKGLLYK